MLNYDGKNKKLDFEGKPGDILNELCAVAHQTLLTLSAETKIPYDTLHKHSVKGLKNVRYQAKGE
jgi:hypothetical protein